MDLKVTKERVLEAAKGCPDADRTLRKLFPEAFTHEIVKMELSLQGFKRAESPHLSMVEVRPSGNLSGCLWLNSGGFDWSFEKDDIGGLCLIARTK